MTVNYNIYKVTGCYVQRLIKSLMGRSIHTSDMTIGKFVQFSPVAAVHCADAQKTLPRPLTAPQGYAE